MAMVFCGTDIRFQLADFGNVRHPALRDLLVSFCTPLSTESAASSPSRGPYTFETKETESFSVVLVGKDGKEMLRPPGADSPKELFAIVDARLMCAKSR